MRKVLEFLSFKLAKVSEPECFELFNVIPLYFHRCHIENRDDELRP